MKNIEIAVPCYNEEVAIEKVIKDFRAAQPTAEIVVYDNCSSDATTQIAKKAGARVVSVPRKGKGFAVRKIFEESRADIVVLVDGDDTYEALDTEKLIQPLIDGEVDMTIGIRLQAGADEFRKLHHSGNRFLTWLLNTLFQTDFKDILSGYRAFNRKFIDSVPLISTGFEIETEIMLQSLENGMAIKEIPIRFRKRPEGSFSKLHSIKDGYRILLMIVSMLRDHKPLFVFSLFGLASAALGAALWIAGYSNLAAAPAFTIMRNSGVLFIELAVGLLLVGLILNTINVRMRELMTLVKRKTR